MPSTKVTVLVCATLILLTLWVVSNNGASFGTSNGGITIQSSGTIAQAYGNPPYPNNLLISGDISQPLLASPNTDGWSGPSGSLGDWRNTDEIRGITYNPNGYGFLITDPTAPFGRAIALEPDPYGISAGFHLGDAGTCGCSSIVTNHQSVLCHWIFWVKTDADTAYPNNGYGLRIAVSGNADDGSYIEVGLSQYTQITGFNGPNGGYVAGCPTLLWGTTTWTKCEIYGYASTACHSLFCWLQAWNGHEGGIANGDHSRCYIGYGFAEILGTQS